MKKDKNRNSVIISCLVVAIIAMSVGYAALAQQLTINGTAGTGDASWAIEFESITKNTTLTSTEGVTEVAQPTASGTSATFDVTLDKPGTKIVYDVVVKNAGTIDATYVSMSGVDEANTAEPTEIQYTVEKTDADKDLLSEAKDTYRVTIEWPASSTTVNTETTSKTATIHFDYEQKAA